MAVYYRDADSIGVLRRMLIDLVDTVVAGLVSILLSIIAMTIAPRDLQALAVLVIWTIVWLAYFVVLKGSRFRTLGYVIAGARIVNLSGERPSYAALYGRLAFVILGPFNFLVDLLWISSDPYKQALRDKVAHTLVIRRDALPAGTGPIVYRVYTLFGWTLMCAEVRPDVAPAAAPTSTA